MKALLGDVGASLRASQGNMDSASAALQLIADADAIFLSAATFRLGM
jgi:DeoR/GlpR family transcriptional regulator of sugar metabolism